MHLSSLRYTPVHLLSEEWADLAIIDLEKAKSPEHRDEFVKIARDAMHKQGFFYVVNHGMDKATACRPLSRLSSGID